MRRFKFIKVTELFALLFAVNIGNSVYAEESAGKITVAGAREGELCILDRVPVLKGALR